MRFSDWCKQNGFYTWVEFRSLYRSSFESEGECSDEYEEVVDEYRTWCKQNHLNEVY